MRRSVDRILTTHTGSLPRPDALLDLVKKRERREPVDAGDFERSAQGAVSAIVQRQREAGLDIVNDGEQSKPDYATYITGRLTGFDGGVAVPPVVPRDARDFPEFHARRATSALAPRPGCTGPIEWQDFAAVEADVARFKTAVEQAGLKPQDTFMTAVSPGQAARFLSNGYYPSHKDYLVALGRVLKREYDAIAEAGLVLQVDCPDLASGWNSQFVNATVPEFVEIVKLHLSVLDDAMRDIPPDQIRLHLCWGNYAGPHNHDIPLSEIVQPVLASRAGAILFEGANPRHEHEWRVFLDVQLPPGKIIIPGVIDSVSMFIEHPRVVADRILRYARQVGRENVMAGVDCGFATFAANPAAQTPVVWAKLQSLVEGARIASQELW